MVEDLKLTKTNLNKLIDWSSSLKNRLKKDEVVSRVMQHVENHDIGVYEYGPDVMDSTVANKWWWTLVVTEKDATIYRSTINDVDNELTEYRLRQYNEHYLTQNENEINNKLADAILDGELSWASDIDNARVYSKNSKVYLSVEKDDQLETVELKDGKIYTDESFKQLSSEEVGELFSFLRFNSSDLKDSNQHGIALNYLHEDYLNQQFDDVSELFNQIAEESLPNRTLVFDSISKGMTNGQVYQILEGVRDGLDISVYADPSYTYKQMYNLRMGMLRELPFALYSDPSIEADKMTVFREALESGVKPEILAALIERNDYSMMSVYDLEAAMDDALDYNDDDLTYLIYTNAGTGKEERFILYRYEDAISKWKQLDEPNKSLSIYSMDIHDKEDNPVVIMDMLSGKERLLLSQAYKDALGIDSLSESPANHLLEDIEGKLTNDFAIDTDIKTVHGERNLDNKVNPVQELTASLEEGVKNIFESGKYQSYLDTLSKFHSYSINNQILIFLQNPEATYVRGYGDDKNARGGWFDLGRQVKRGEKAIKILAPLFVTEKYKGELFNTVIKELENHESYHLPYTNISILKNKDKSYSICNNGLVSKDKLSKYQLNDYLNRKVLGKELCGFKVVNVFDISQCIVRKVKDMDGNLVNDPRADAAVLSLTGNIDNKAPEKMDLLFDVLVSVSDKSQVPIEIKGIQGSNGYYDLESKRIAVSDSLNEAHKVKTAIHEIAHSRLHNNPTSLNNMQANESLRGAWEVQAESIAYVVSKELGLDTSDYSFGYIAGWSSGKEMEELKKSMDIISIESKKLINDIDNELKSRNLDRSLLVAKEPDPSDKFDFSETYRKDPFFAFASLKNKNSSKNNNINGLTDNDIHFMINSKYIKERYGSAVKHTPDKFINKSLEQLNKARSLEGYGKDPFVEISFCENVFDKLIFDDGQVLNMQEANERYQKAEANIQARNKSNKSKDADFPYMKCYASVYVPVEHEGKKTLAVIHTKTCIGDGQQTGLVDALKNSDKLNDFGADIKNQIISMISMEQHENFDIDRLSDERDKGLGKAKQKVNDYKAANIKETNRRSDGTSKSSKSKESKEGVI